MLYKYVSWVDYEALIHILVVHVYLLYVITSIAMMLGFGQDHLHLLNVSNSESYRCEKAHRRLILRI